MRYIKFAVLAALFALPVSSADAGIVSSLLTSNGVQDSLVDQSVDSFLDVDGSGTFNLGDVLFGIAQIDQVQPDGGASITVAPARIGVAFAAEVTSFEPVGSLPTQDFFSVEFGAVTSAGNTLNDLLGAGFAGTFDNDTIFAVFERSAGGSLLDVPNTPGTADALQIFTDVGADAFDFVFSGGLEAGDFFESTIGFNSTTGDFVGGDQRGGFTITNSTIGTVGTDFLPVDVTRLDGTTVSSHDITIDVGSNISPADGLQLTNGFAFENNVQFSINTVPEPTSALTFLGVFAICVARRRTV